jgi:hypothetical protein
MTQTKEKEPRQSPTTLRSWNSWWITDDSPKVPSMCKVRSGRMCNTVSNNSSITNVPADIYVTKSKNSHYKYNSWRCSQVPEFPIEYFHSKCCTAQQLNHVSLWKVWLHTKHWNHLTHPSGIWCRVPWYIVASPWSNLLLPITVVSCRQQQCHSAYGLHLNSYTWEYFIIS